jgi:asparagine synthase (glutamine-hydrolysing)
MRPRFLFLSGRQSERRDAVARRLHGLLPERRVAGSDTIFLSAECPVIDLPSVGGWLVGRLYSSDGRDGRHALSGPEQLAIMSSAGRALIEKHSGSYVAIWRGHGDAPLIGLRDPSACLPAFFVRLDDGYVVASDVECLHRSGLLSLRIDGPGVAEYLSFPFAPSARTCLTGIEELRPGFATMFGTSVSSRALWLPRIVAGMGRTDPAMLARTIDGVIDGECAGHMRPGVELSGGLDSSIVTAALGAERRPQALHMVPQAQDGDERRYARLVTERFGLALHEIPIPFEDIDLAHRPDRLTARPTNVAHFRVMNAKLRDARIAANLYPVFSGGGGDSIFCSLASTGLVLDAWRDCGVAGARVALAELAGIAGVTQWEALRHVVIRVGNSVWGKRGWTANRQLLGTSCMDTAPPDSAQLDGLSPGLRAHVASVLRMQTMLDAHDRVATDDLRFPLMSQPVLEACFSVPSWQWVRGGRDRAVAREAFAGRLPAAIIERRGKGRYDTFTVRTYERSRSVIREALLGGWLADHGMIDQRAVEDAIALPVTATSTIHARLIYLLETEYWCRMILDRQSEAGPG